MEDKIYDHYVAIDWAQRNMAIARMTKKSNQIKVIDVPANIGDLRVYLANLKGSKILVIEETTTSQWLYTELKHDVDRIVICDPYRNRLLSDGPKTDKIDAAKLVQLLRANLIKEIYHSDDRFVSLRRLVSGYEDLVRAGVRAKNQRSALLRACGQTGHEKTGIDLKGRSEQFVIASLDRQIKSYEVEKAGYEKEFRKLAKQHKDIRHQNSIPGIGLIGAVTIVARVVSPYRFTDSGHYWSYAGLIQHEKISGQVSYGRRQPRYCRALKAVYKTAALSTLKSSNAIRESYEYLIKEKAYPEHNARHKIARHLAAISLGVFKSGKKYQRRTVSGNNPMN